MIDEGALYGLSEGWVWAITSEVCSSVRDGTHDTPKYVEVGVPLITSKNLKENIIDFSTSKNISIDDHEKISRRSGVENGDVLFAMIGTIGNPVVVQTERIFSIKNVALFKKNESTIISQYLMLWLASSVFNTILVKNEFLKGTTQKFIPLGNLRILPIPLPPILEQRAIVSKIEQLFSDLDNGIENFKKAQEQLKIYRQAVLKNACEGKLVPTEAELARAEGRDYESADVLLARILKEKREKWNGKGKYKEPVALDVGELPELSEGWEYARLRDISHAIGGYAFKSSDFKENGTYQVIKIGNVKMGHFRLDKKPSFIDNINSQIFNKYRLNYGDLVITLTGTRKKRDYGFVAMVKNEKQMLLNQRLAVVRFFKPLIPEYFQYALRTEHFQNNFFKYETGNVGQGNVSMNAIISETIAIPPLAEQHRIFAEVESCLSLCDNMEETIAESLQKAESLRQSILKKAFEGKLLNEKELEEVRNAPDWEPADKLLERIKAQKNN